MLAREAMAMTVSTITSIKKAKRGGRGCVGNDCG